MTGYEILIFLFGLVTGSFMNVLIYRIPRNLSIVRPGSRCPQCGAPIKPLDNIPLLSFILLGGRCRSCGSRIHWRYPLVEFLNGALWVLAYYRYDLGLSLLPLLLFLSGLVVITFIDLEHMIIPDVITLPGALVGIILSPLLMDPFARYDYLGFINSLFGALTGFILFLIISIAGTWFFKKEAMGGGDIKLMAMVGAFTGWKGVLLTTFSGSLLGAIVGIAIILRKKSSDTTIPFGPYLAMGAMVSLFFGEEILRLYL